MTINSTAGPDCAVMCTHIFHSYRQKGRDADFSFLTNVSGGRMDPFGEKAVDVNLEDGAQNL